MTLPALLLSHPFGASIACITPSQPSDQNLQIDGGSYAGVI